MADPDYPEVPYPARKPIPYKEPEPGPFSLGPGDRQDIEEGLESAGLSRAPDLPGPSAAEWVLATGVRGVARDYLKAIQDVHEGKVTPEDRAARINQSSAEARKFWGLGQPATPPVQASAVGAPGTPLASPDIVRPPAAENPPPDEPDQSSSKHLGGPLGAINA